MDVLENKSDEHTKKSTKKIQRKLLYIAWKHKSSLDERFYKQMRDPVGGIKKIELDHNSDYSFDEIRQLSIAAMRNTFNEHIFDLSVVMLASNDEEIITKFTNVKRQQSEIPKKNHVNRETPSIQRTSSSFGIDFKLPSRQGSFGIRVSNKENIPQAKKPAINLQSSSIKIIPLSHRPAFTLNNGPPSVTSKEQSLPEKENVQAVTLRAPLIDIRNGSEVAVKTILANSSQKYLIREMKTMDTVCHPNVISLMAVSSDDVYMYIVMEYFDSKSLRFFINNRDDSTEHSEKMNINYYICLQISKAISYIHELIPMIIYKDIKPENILIKHFMIKICDLGLGKICDSSLTSALNTTVGRNFCGTPMYMAPEILIYNSPASTNSDVWSMSCCFVELFTEESIWYVKPFSIPNLRIVVMDKKKPNLDEIPIKLRSHIGQCFDHDPSNRPKALSSVTVFERQWNGHRY
ncbi:hypothetical protein KQX54_006382 [Cotesia glomerata]|uniref:Protein kinase domain-containing protein n=1 Tax=Cotesia glomerata TaxID=32391 RepID=A0AAV7IK95_COTGL|nr:hypothetical protein KQX54_006382 [Cotesia glomerata]